MTIKITYSPCSKCRTELKNFFASLPRGRSSHYRLSIEFANLYHEGKSNTEEEIRHLAAWRQSLEDINVKTDFRPLCVSKDPEFNPADLGIAHSKIREREMKDKQVSGYVRQIIETIQQPDELSHRMENLGLNSKANELKMQGNASLQKGDVSTAIKLYTKAIELDPTNHVLYSNRSLALCRERRYERALQDADTSIQLKANWTKGHYHRGTALMHLKQFSDAASAYEQALRIQPKNEEIRSALSVVNEKLMARRIASGFSKGINVPSRPPTKAQLQEQKTRSAMDELHSDKKIRTLLQTGNALQDVPPAVRKALANSTSKKEVSSNENLPTGTYVIHHEKIKLPNGSTCCLSLNVHLEFSHETVSGSGRVKIITRYYNLIYEWK